MSSLFRRLCALIFLTSCIASGQTAWVDSGQSGTEARFLYSDHIRRYDLTAKSWLAPITLPRSAATAMAVDAQGAVVVYGSSVYRYGPGFTGESLLGNVPNYVQSLFLDGNLVIAVQSGGRVNWTTILDRTTGAILSTGSFTSPAVYGATHAPMSNRLYGRTLENRPNVIVTASYSDAGIASYIKTGPTLPASEQPTRCWVFPDEKRVLDTSGAVFYAPSLKVCGDLGVNVNDVAFHGDAPIVLRGGEVIGFTSRLLETGRAAVGVSTGAKIFVTATEAFVFSPSGGNPAVNIVPLAAVNAVAPGTPADPNGLAYAADDVFTDLDGNLLLFSKTQFSLFRWSPASRQYTGSFPLTDVPLLATYSKENHSAYFAYETNAVKVLDLAAAEPHETLFTTLAGTPGALESASGLIVTNDLSNRYGNLSVFSPSGVLTDTISSSYAKTWQWDPVQRRMYQDEGSSSPSNLFSWKIDAAGMLGERKSPPHPVRLSTTPPIRLSPDGTTMVLGSGVIVDTGEMDNSCYLANDISDAVWFGGKLVTLRLFGGGSQLQTWEGNQYLLGTVVRQINGTPVRVLNTPSGLVVVTSVDGVPRFTLFDSSFVKTFESPIRPSAAKFWVETERTSSSVSLQWQDTSDNEDGFRLDYRIGLGPWLAGATLGAGVTQATVSGLAPGTVYEFRVGTTLGTLVTLSASKSVKTLSTPDEPVGEPYGFRIASAYDDRITLEWSDNASNETAFHIYRSTVSTELGTMFSVPPGSISFTDTGLVANTYYYYRVQAVNGMVVGDLSARLSQKTLAGATAPAKPTLVATVRGFDAVDLTWYEYATNEDEYVIERSGSPAAIWTEIGRVGADVKTFTDPTVLPGTTYNYRVKASNATGVTSSSWKEVTLPKAGGEFAGKSMRGGDVQYFAFSGPDRIERYDLASRSWLPPLPLQAPVSALWVDEFAIYVSHERLVLRMDLDGGNVTAMGAAPYRVNAIFTMGDTLVFESWGDFTTVDKRTVTPLARFSFENGAVSYSVVPLERTAIFTKLNTTYAAIYTIEIGTDGKLVTTNQGLGYGVSTGARTFMFPGGDRVAEETGNVFTTDALHHVSNLGGPITDLDFQAADLPVVLRDDKLFAYDTRLLESGMFALDRNGLRVAVQGLDALVFSEDANLIHGLSVRAVPLSAIVPPVLVPADPYGVDYTPDDVFLDKDGKVLLFSKARASLFRWSPDLRQYLSTVPLSGSPAFAAYSKETHHAYFAYQNQVVRKMDLGSPNPVETVAFNITSPPRGMTMAGEFAFVANSFRTSTYSTGDVEIPNTMSDDYFTRGDQNIWDPVMRRVYHFRDNSSPGDLHYDSISASGAITGGGETPYHGVYSYQKPIRVSPDGSKVVIGSGIVFKGSDLTVAASLANGFTDAAWFGGQLVTARSLNGGTQIQTWTGDQFVAGPLVRQYSGTPVRLLALDSGRLLLITLNGGMTGFVMLNASLDATYISPTKPLPPSTLTVTGRETTSVSLHWQDNSSNEDGFRIEVRPVGGAWINGGTVPANGTSGTVSGLGSGTLFEFRVVATLGNLSSAPSAGVSVATLDGSEQPIGEPYFLRVSRIFEQSITLEWQDNASNETGFRILRSTTAEEPTTEMIAPAGATSFASSGLTAGTTYYFRVQVVNGGASGDLSAQVSAKTLAASLAPKAPGWLMVPSRTSTSVSLLWSDISSDEDTFLIERLVFPHAVWTQVASVPFNTVSYTDNTVVPGTGYSYRVSSVNAFGSASSSAAGVYTPKVGGEFLGMSQRVGNVYYFVMGGPNRIERYDFVNRGWLEPIPLEAAATAMWVDESGIFVAEDRAVMRFTLDGSAVTVLANDTETVDRLVTLKNLLVYGNSATELHLVNKNSGAVVSNISYYFFGAGFSTVPALDRIYFIRSGSPPDVCYMEIGPTGDLIKVVDTPYHGTYSVGTRCIVFPDKTRVADPSGNVYSGIALNYNNSFGGAFTDLDFFGTNVPIVLRDDKLLSYTDNLTEHGSLMLDEVGLRVVVAGSDAVVFSVDSLSPRGLSVRAIPLSSFAAPGSQPFEVRKISRKVDGGVGIEISTQAGRHYRIQYSDDAVNWKFASDTLVAEGTTVNWIDRGPPATESSPSVTPCRLYRVMLVP